MRNDLNEQQLNEIIKKIVAFKKSTASQRKVQAKVRPARDSIVYVKKKRRIDAEVYRQKSQCDTFIMIHILPIPAELL